VQAATVGVTNSSLGKVLVDSQGRTLAAAADVQGALRYEQVIGYVRRGARYFAAGGSFGRTISLTRRPACKRNEVRLPAVRNPDVNVPGPRPRMRGGRRGHPDAGQPVLVGRQPLLH
jgi:hypothetical protein